MYTSRSEQDELTLADVGFRICQLRRERNLSQLQLAELVGVARTTVTVWEGGNAEMNLTKLFKIAKALNCDVRELLTDHPTDFDKRRAELAAIRIINSLLR
jgi:transcriptional regulator with XRE-family HTH domain